MVKYGYLDYVHSITEKVNTFLTPPHCKMILEDKAVAVWSSFVRISPHFHFLSRVMFLKTSFCQPPPTSSLSI